MTASPGRDISQANAGAAAARVVRPVLYFEMEITDSSPSDFVRASDLPFDTAWGGRDWTGVGLLGGVSPIEESIDLRAQGFQVRLNGISLEAVAIALGRHIQGDPVILYLGFLDEGHGLIDTPFVFARGRADVMRITAGETASITLTVENVLADWERPRIRRYNNADQQQRYPGDRGLEFVEQTVDKDVIWPNQNFRGQNI